MSFGRSPGKISVVTLVILTASCAGGPSTDGTGGGVCRVRARLRRGEDAAKRRGVVRLRLRAAARTLVRLPRLLACRRIAGSRARS